MSSKIGNALAQFFKPIKKVVADTSAVDSNSSESSTDLSDAPSELPKIDAAPPVEETVESPIHSTSASSQLIFIFQYIRGHRKGYLPKLGKRAYSNSIKNQKKGGRAGKGALINLSDDDAA